MSLAQRAAALPPPTHVAIIMDGNGRWARKRSLPRVAGHKSGAEAVRRTVRCAAELGIGFLTLYGFSSENWKRPPREVDDLMGLLRWYLRAELAELHSNGVRLRVIGNRKRLPADIVSLIDHAEEQTRGNGGLTLTIALSYGGREEIVAAAQALAARIQAGDLAPEEIDEEAFASELSTVGIPDPDLIIRTSGEQHRRCQDQRGQEADGKNANP